MSASEDDLRARHAGEDKKILSMLEVLARVDLAILNLRDPGVVPALAESGVTYDGWRELRENYGDVDQILTRGTADAAELTAWRVAELRRAGEAARAILVRRPGRPWLCTLLVLRPDGTTEDATALVASRPPEATDMLTDPPGSGNERVDWTSADRQGPECPGCAAGKALVGAEIGHEHYRRASGEVACPTCGEPYRRHPHAVYLDWQGEPWLTRLCSGDLVKL